MSLVFLSMLFDWRDALIIVRPETLIRWHRAGWRLLWRWKCRVGYEDSYRYLIHDRDSIFAKSLDESIGRLGMRILKSAPQSPMVNACL